MGKDGAAAVGRVVLSCRVEGDTAGQDIDTTRGRVKRLGNALRAKGLSARATGWRGWFGAVIAILSLRMRSRGRRGLPPSTRARYRRGSHGSRVKPKTRSCSLMPTRPHRARACAAVSCPCLGTAAFGAAACRPYPASGAALYVNRGILAADAGRMPMGDAGLTGLLADPVAVARSGNPPAGEQPNRPACAGPAGHALPDHHAPARRPSLGRSCDENGHGAWGPFGPATRSARPSTQSRCRAAIGAINLLGLAGTGAGTVQRFAAAGPFRP